MNVALNFLVRDGVEELRVKYALKNVIKIKNTIMIYLK